MKKYKKITCFSQCAILAITLFLLFGIVFTKSPAITTASSVSQNGRLQVKNGKIVNKNRKTYQIKGVSTHGLAWYPKYVNQKAFASLKNKWGVNTIRLAMYTEEYNGYCNSGSANKTKLKKLINDGVKAATNLGMYVIIDWHILSDGNPKKNQKQATAFFKEMATKYKKSTNVLFEICNEPNGAGTWNNIYSYATSIIKTIRNTGNNNLIIVGTPTWSQDVDCAVKKPLKGKNIAYAFHFYAGTHKQDMRNKLEKALKSKLPVIVTEFGITDASGNGSVNTTEGNKWITLLNKYHVGRVCWNLSNKNESSALIKSSCNKTNNWKLSDLSKQGKWLIKTYKGSLK